MLDSPVKGTPMATAAQISACAANAQLSTGPRSPEGKAVSSRNALKLGIYSEAHILPGEDPTEYAELLQDFTRPAASSRTSPHSCPLPPRRPLLPPTPSSTYDQIRFVLMPRRERPSPPPSEPLTTTGTTPPYASK
jgi:hypothetical protein